MDLLLTVGAYALWFVIQSLVTLYFAAIGGIGLAAGFHTFKSWTTGHRERRNLKEAEQAMDEVEEKVAAGAVVT